MAAVLAGGPEAVLSHQSAGRLWRLIPADRGAVHITRPGGFRTRRPGIEGHEGRLADDEISRADGIAVTSPFRTVFDLSSLLSKRQLERAINEAEVRGFVDRVSLPELLERHPGHRGAVNLQALLDANDPGGVTRNDFEEAFVALIDAHDLPRPRLNADLQLRGRFYEVDCCWPSQRVVVELDGRAAHGTRRAFETDRERDRILLAEGWRPMHVTWRQLQEEPEMIVSDLRRLLESRAVV
jgi:very-short-patch-repair endonuclease